MKFLEFLKFQHSFIKGSLLSIMHQNFLKYLVQKLNYAFFCAPTYSENAFLIFLKSYRFCKYSNGCHTFNSISLALEKLASQLIYQNTQGRWRKTVVTKKIGCGKWGGQPPPLKTEISIILTFLKKLSDEVCTILLILLYFTNRNNY